MMNLISHNGRETQHYILYAQLVSGIPGVYVKETCSAAETESLLEWNQTSKIQVQRVSKRPQKTFSLKNVSRFILMSSSLHVSAKKKERK